MFMAATGASMRQSPLFAQQRMTGLLLEKSPIVRLRLGASSFVDCAVPTHMDGAGNLGFRQEGRSWNVLRRTRGFRRFTGLQSRVAPLGRDSFQDLHHVVAARPSPDFDCEALAAKVIDYQSDGPVLSELPRSNHVPKA